MIRSEVDSTGEVYHSAQDHQRPGLFVGLDDVKYNNSRTTVVVP